MIDDDVVVRAYKLSTRQRQRYRPDEMCGCFHCGDRFTAIAIRAWCDETDEKQTTAMCPACGVDSVISVNDVQPLGVMRDEFEGLLVAMKQRWFSQQGMRA